MRSISNGPARTPGTGVRILLFLLAVMGGLVLLFLGFPPGAPDRLPVLIVALALALASAGRGDRGVTAFCFLLPCTGLLVRFFGGSDPIAWPVLLFAGLASGWCFRFIYDFESVPEPSSADGSLAALCAIWILGGLLALARAHTLWAALNGLAGRAVNGAGLSETIAIRESTFALSVLCAGAAFYFLLRRSGEDVRRRAAQAALYGVGVSAAASLFQWAEILPPEPSPFWRMTGRLSGGAADPNSLGLLCAFALVYAVVAHGRSEQRRGLFGVLAAVLLAGLFLSGSRSGFLVVLLALGGLLVGKRLSARNRMAAAAGIAAVLLAAALLLWRGAPGTLAGRLSQTFDPATSFEYRVSGRRLLWSSALRLFSQSPLAGSGLGAFKWRLPDLVAEMGAVMGMRDNAGNAYIQALAETGVPGFLVTVAFAWTLGRAAARRLPGVDADPVGAGAGAAVLAFLLALLLGSWWFAPDFCLFFFLLAALAAGTRTEPAGRSWRPLHWAAVGFYALATTAAVLTTARPEETFRYDSRIGFYEREEGPGGPFCWTRGRFAVRLAPGEERRMTLAHYTPQREPVGIEAVADGRRVYSRTLEPGQAVILRLAAPPGRPSVVLFRLSRTFNPKRLGLSDDRRELGLVLILPKTNK